MMSYEKYVTKCEYLAQKMDYARNRMDKFQDAYVGMDMDSWYPEKEAKLRTELIEIKALFKETEEQYFQQCVDHNTKRIG